MLQQVLGLLLSQVEPIVDKAPSEVVDVQLAVTIVVHGFEDAGDSLDSSRGAIQKFCFHFLDQVVDGKGFELLHRHGVTGVGRVAHEPHVLVMLELRWHVSCSASVVLESQILSSVLDGEGVAHDLFLATEVVLVTAVVTSQVVASAAVSDQNGVLSSHGLALSFHSEVGVEGVDDPHAGKIGLGVHRGFIVSGNRRERVLAFGDG